VSLATALSALDRDEEVLWIGWPGLEVGDPGEQGEVERRLREEHRCIPVFLTRAQLERYYDGFSNGCLWPLFHYFPQYAHYDEAEWDAYRQVNRAFAERVLTELRPGDRVWVQDYHLMLLPALIRETQPEVPIGFFLHIPFPSSEIYRMLPWRAEILEGLIGADLVGFHSFGYTRHFLSSLLRLLGLDQSFGQVMVRGRPVQAETFPLGVDVERFAAVADDPEAQAELERLRREADGRRIVLSVDRLDFTKGLLERLQAFDRFLSEHPEWRKRVTFIMLCVPSRERVPEYRSLKRRVDEWVGRINGRHGQPGWSPIWYLYRALPFNKFVPLYQLADVALVTPLRDGMNLVAKEYLAARPDNRGVLVLSETAGAAEELGEALIVNPHDTRAMVAALNQALAMPPEEQRARNERMRTRLKRYDTKRWADEFLTRLDETRRLSPQLTQIKLEGEALDALKGAYQASRKRLLMLDYDGTLVPFSRRPDGAAPPPELVEELKALAADPRNDVVVISGRDADTLAGWLGDIWGSLVAEHGAYTRRPGNDWERIEGGLSAAWKEQLRPVLEVYADRTPGALLEEKQDGLAWHYRNADPELGALRAKELIEHLDDFISNTSLHVLRGNRVVEIRNGRLNKGNAAQRWLASGKHYDFILAAGDDTTDEDLFAAMPEDAWTVKVRRARNSRARHYVPSPARMRELLAALNASADA